MICSGKVAAQPIDCAGDERAAPQAIGAEHCARRRTTRHLRWVDAGLVDTAFWMELGA
jgi:hypothetical protein